ncbi:MAG: gamma-glutamyltransferase [Cytophagales bacterium]|nr:gamma-glutamyltransferase [Cytophagales bacterium]
MKRLFVGILLLLITVALIALVAGISFRSALGPAHEHYPERAVYAPHASVATSQPLASQAGLAVLQHGGNAIDAAITAAAVLSVVEPHMSGLGGDLFAILWSAEEQQLVGINASGRSGTLMTREALSKNGRIPGDGPKTITIPGALSGWSALLERYGTITLKEALEPAIAIAREGFPISDVTAAEWKVFESILKSDSGAIHTFLNNDSQLPEPGDWFSNPDYATTLQQIATYGPQWLYGGELGNNIAHHVKKLGGFLTPLDFAEHQAVWEKPIATSFNGYNIWQMPPNGQGLAVLEMFKLLEDFDLESMEHNSAAYLHYLIEAKKLAFADLEQVVGDPSNMMVSPMQLLSDEYIANRRSYIDANQAMAVQEPDPSLTHSETTYLAAVDENGNMVSLISSLAGGFGSGVVVPGTGFALQNRGVGFTYEPNRVNTVAPKTLPFHTIIPGFVTKTISDGKDEPWLAYGIVGGPQQPQAQVQVLLNMMLFDMNVQEALDAPRFRHWEDNRVSFESSIPASVIKSLRKMGHAPQNPIMETAQTIFLGSNGGLTFGCGQVIMKNKKGYIAGSDTRRDGIAAAY